MSHHFDSAADRADGRINPCDLYAFPGAPGTTTFILTVNPDAGRSSPTTFRPDARYEFAIASNGGTTEDKALRVTFRRQRLRHRRRRSRRVDPRKRLHPTPGHPGLPLPVRAPAG